MKAQRIFLFLIMVSTVALAQSNPVPLINNPLVPDAVAPGGQSFTLTVNGTGFVPGSTVDWNGTPLATAFVSGSQLTATVPAANIATPSTASVTVVNPAPVGSSNVDFFDIRQPFTAVSFGQSSLNGGVDYPQNLLAADLNGDGLQDVVGSGQDSISIFIGDGDGTFQPPINYPVALSGPVVTGDFNGDGKLDLAFVDQGTGYPAIMLGNGNGAFGPITEFVLSSYAICCLATADFNADGKLDLAISLYTGEVAILLGNGDGTFQNDVDYPAGSANPFGITVGDFNGDGNLDLAVAVDPDSAVSILLGNGDGTFQPARRDSPFSCFPRTSSSHRCAADCTLGA